MTRRQLHDVRRGDMVVYLNHGISGVEEKTILGRGEALTTSCT